MKYVVGGKVVCINKLNAIFQHSSVKLLKFSSKVLLKSARIT